MGHIFPPQSRAELLQRSHALAGLTLAEIASRHHLPVPTRLHYAKGWIGQLLEHCLGADAGPTAAPDFQQLGIELKTIPVNQLGHPRESTYVCTVPLNGEAERNWQSSWVRNKLACVMWLPIEAEPQIPIERRRIGTAILWSPSAQEEQCLRQDWEEHMELIQCGRIHEISAHHGTCLQIRPKAANKMALCATTDEDGQQVKTLPRGFYLRPSFTATILRQAYC